MENKHMKKIFYITVFSLLITSLIYCKERKTVRNNELKGKNKAVEIKEWEYGFALNEEGNPLYFDINKNIMMKMPVNYFFKSKKEITKIKGDLIIGSSVQIFKNKIRINNAFKNKPGLVRGHQNIKHKIENNASYVSSDGEKWEKLKIKYFKDTGEKNRYDNPLILVYFECSFFKGEYELGFRL